MLQWLASPATRWTPAWAASAGGSVVGGLDAAGLDRDGAAKLAPRVPSLRPRRGHLPV